MTAQVLAAILAVAEVILFIFRWLEHRGQVNEAKRAVEKDLVVLRRKWSKRSAAAVDSLDTTPEGVLNDRHNRDTLPEVGTDRPADSL